MSHTLNKLFQWVIATLAAVLACPIGAQMIEHPPDKTVATLPSCTSDRNGRIYSVTDGATATDCVTGAASTTVLCQCNGTSWGAVAAGGFSPNADPGVDHSSYIAGHADGANCAAGEIPLGVDASGAVEGCYEPAEADISDLAHTATAITDGLIVEADLNEDSGTPTDEDVLTYDSTGANFNWVAQSGLAAGTAAALAANGANCGAGNYPLGVDAAGAVESCTAVSSSAISAGDSDVTLVDAGTGEVQFNLDGTLGVLVTANKIRGATRIDLGQQSNGSGVYIDTSRFAAITSGNSFSMALTAGSSVWPTYAFRSDGQMGLWYDGTNVGISHSGTARILASSVGATVSSVLTITPQATAPATCSIGDLYIDTSGAACACSATNTWSNMHATGSCA